MDRADLEWIEEFELRTVRDAEELLREVKLELERGGDNEARVSASGYKGEFGLRVADEEPMIQERLQLAQMLGRKQIIQEVTLRRGGGSPYDASQSVLVVRADLAVVTAALERMGERMGRRTRSPVRERKPEAPTTPAATAAARSVPDLDEVRKRTHAEEWARFPYALALGVAIPVILAMLAVLFTPIGDWLKARYFPKTPAAQTAPDTTGRKTQPRP